MNEPDAFDVGTDLAYTDGAVIFENEFLTWRGTAADLETSLRDSKYAREADRLFRFNTACGVYLARLHEQDPERIKKTKTNGKVKWAISPPQKSAALD